MPDDFLNEEEIKVMLILELEFDNLAKGAFVKEAEKAPMSLFLMSLNRSAYSTYAGASAGSAQDVYRYKFLNIPSNSVTEVLSELEAGEWGELY